MEQQSSRQAPQQRRPFNPFLRKPLWVILKEDCGAHLLSSNESTTNNGGGDVELSQLSHHDNDEHEDDNADNEDGFSFEYGDQDQDDNGHHESPLEPQTRQSSSAQHHHSQPPRHLTLFDLVSIGVGGTIGSGIFVLNGLIAHSYAGPATFLSWMISGVAALLSGCCYAELSGRIPSAGSSYAYAFVALGELPAFVTAGMLTLEFLLSGSAVAR